MRECNPSQQTPGSSHSPAKAHSCQSQCTSSDTVSIIINFCDIFWIDPFVVHTDYYPFELHDCSNVMAAEVWHISNLSTPSIRELPLAVSCNKLYNIASYLPTRCHGKKYLCSSLEVQQGVLINVTQTDATAVAPPEILSLSLDTNCPAESLDVRKGAWPYGRVCHRWRDLVLSNLFLWDHFVLQITQPFPEWPLPDVPEAIRYGPGSINIAKAAQIQYRRHYDNFINDKMTLSSLSVSILMEYLKRSGGVPLHVSLEVPESVELANRDIKDAFFAFLLLHVSCWKTLQCTVIKEPVCALHFADILILLDITPMKISSSDSNHTITTLSHLRSVKVFLTDVLDQPKAPVLDKLAISSTHQMAALRTFMERSQIFDRLQ
ncbi:hypothetical protein ARMGADRAFT_1034471 [Armillaria gallica]|uniref:F-box domain-containing protein n=1 Tax=Armillaria gallica TaxID=47427 RepID=A0A2H3D8V5_ARMGA|nr:hypothetical protein ARMGADRAFT_1034471 [Armillaria gallica]